VKSLNKTLASPTIMKGSRITLDSLVYIVLRSRKELHNFFGAGTLTRCGSGFKLHVHHRWIIKNITNCNSFLLFPFKYVTISIIQKSNGEIGLFVSKRWLAIQKGRSRSWSRRSHIKNFPEPLPHKDDAAL
jgi:hypothetical protein